MLGILITLIVIGFICGCLNGAFDLPGDKDNYEQDND